MKQLGDILQGILADLEQKRKDQDKTIPSREAEQATKTYTMIYTNTYTTKKG